MHTSPTVAIVVYQGVLVDETEVFRFVLSRIPDLQTIMVGTTRGDLAGPGGVETAVATLEEIGNPEVIVVPGGIGCDRRTDIADWLKTVSPAWILASSTGSTLLAAAGLLRKRTAATHWLAGSLLERYGAHPSREPLVVDGRIVTCSGASSAFRAALVIAEAYGGLELVRQIRIDAGAISKAPEPRPRRAFWQRLWYSIRRPRNDPDLVQARNEPLITDSNVLDLGTITLGRARDDRIDH
jgi:transcriptional regulator GlxA family with amidase domain